MRTTDEPASRWLRSANTGTAMAKRKKLTERALVGATRYSRLTAIPIVPQVAVAMAITTMPPRALPRIPDTVDMLIPYKTVKHAARSNVCPLYRNIVSTVSGKAKRDHAEA